MMEQLWKARQCGVGGWLHTQERTMITGISIKHITSSALTRDNIYIERYMTHNIIDSTHVTKQSAKQLKCIKI